MGKGKKETSLSDESDIYCPLCNNVINQIIVLNIKGGEKAPWYLCRCGYMFHLQAVDRSKIFNADYLLDYAGRKMIDVKYDYYLRIYMPIIEELTYGRRFLDVGCCTGHIVNSVKNRGWVATGIDLIETDFINGDFETFDFEISKGYMERFDCIFMLDVIQCFLDPVGAIQKAVDLLRPNGLLFIVTPNTDLMKNDQIPYFGHWDMQQNRSFINERILSESLLKSVPDFRSKMEQVISIPSNTSQRFVSWNNMHMLYQKKSIEEIKVFDDVKKEVEDAKS